MVDLRLSARVLPAIAALAIAGCVSRVASIERAADQAGLTVRRWSGPDFTLYGRLRNGGSGPLVVVIEGDGAAWSAPDRPPSDPTPRDPAGMRLAAASSAARVLYLARPCQYGGVGVDAACDVDVWTSRRFSPRVIDALNRAVDKAKAETGATRVELAGFSGGGTVATLLAESRPDVDRLTTICAPLDTEAWTSFHHVTPLDGLNPADHADRLRGLPQRHVTGGSDTVVPPELARDFTRRFDLPAPEVVPGKTHADDWVSVVRL